MNSKQIFISTLLGLFATFQVYSQSNFYDFVVTDITGKDFAFSRLKGKKVIIVNTASKCGLTPQFEDLQKLYETYGGEDFTIIGFPSNDFMNQDPGTNEEIASFCKLNYGVTFPMMSKISVKGDSMHPVYRWLTSKSLNGLEDSSVSWNFQKYLIDEEGKLVGHIVPRKKPDTGDIIAFITGN
ncbi:MAG: glutathione peroxidase [Bacteroidales bacterium]|nr:glutathione peroxidase [Bacteroidales bacterium]MBN2697391.1 glutathione peroxidase [Bacteroidales bacterium]